MQQTSEQAVAVQYNPDTTLKSSSREAIVHSKLEPEAEIPDIEASLQQTLHATAAEESKRNCNLNFNLPRKGLILTKRIDLTGEIKS